MVQKGWVEWLASAYFFKIPIKVFSLDVSLSSIPELGIVAGVEALDVGADTAGDGPDDDDGMLRKCRMELVGYFPTFPTDRL